LSRFNV